MLSMGHDILLISSKGLHIGQIEKRSSSRWVTYCKFIWPFWGNTQVTVWKCPAETGKGMKDSVAHVKNYACVQKTALFDTCSGAPHNIAIIVRSRSEESIFVKVLLISPWIPNFSDFFRQFIKCLVQNYIKHNFIKIANAVLRTDGRDKRIPVWNRTFKW